MSEIAPEPEPLYQFKMYCVWSPAALKLIKGVRGKFGTQNGHAYLHAYWDAEDRFAQTAFLYRNSGIAAKITLALPVMQDHATEVQTLRGFAARYTDRCGVSLVEDRGLTVFKEPTVTCLGIGPLHLDEVGDDLKALKPLT